MKILSAPQIRDVDAHTIKNVPIDSIDLMERASRGFVEWFIRRFNKSVQIATVCGTGNNGGDGLAISRLLIEQGFRVTPCVIRVSPKSSDDFNTNFERLSQLTEIVELTTEEELHKLDQPDVFIDGIFGSGLSRPAEGLYGKAINYMNNCGVYTVAIDIASGLYCDEHSPGPVMTVSDTLSFQLPKLAFMLPENDPYVGNWHLIDIGLDKKFIDQQDTNNILLDREIIQGIIKKRKKHAHKGTFGKALLISGSFGKMGATVLCGQACMRSGVGLLTIHAPECGYQILQTSVPEAIVSVDKHEKYFTTIPEDLDRFTALGIGPGLDKDNSTVKALNEVLSRITFPVVIDADGLNILSENQQLIHLIPAHSILTPHPIEFDRLAGEAENDFHRLENAKNFSIEYQVYVVLKGAHTAVVTPDGNVFFNNTGNPGMATGGSGDVLTGIITGLLSQDYSSLHAALFGVYLHGLSGDLAVTNTSEASLIASDLIKYLPNAFKKLL